MKDRIIVGIAALISFGAVFFLTQWWIGGARPERSPASRPAPVAEPADPVVVDLLLAVDTLRMALNTWEQVGETVEPCGSRDATGVPPCLQSLGFTAKDPAGATFWVETEGDGFQAHGIVDADHDGVFAEVVATDERAARRVTPVAVR